jgi:hypothetical protein
MNTIYYKVDWRLLSDEALQHYLKGTKMQRISAKAEIERRAKVKACTNSQT